MRDKSILIVDDDPRVGRAMARELRSMAARVEVAANGEEALRGLAAGPPDLTFLDLHMPVLGGLDVLREMKRRWPKARVVMTTSHASVPSAVEAMRLGAADFLVKPFARGALEQMARLVLEREELEEASAVDYGSLLELVKRHVSDQNLAAARESVRKAIGADPGRPEAYNLLGALGEIAGEWLGAERFYRVALAVDPTYEPARANLLRTTSWSKLGEIDLGRRPPAARPRPKRRARKGPIVIVGCGRLGSALAGRLSRDGDSVIVIDAEASAFAGLSADFSGFKVTGDATHRPVLSEAGIETADVVLATTGDDDVNLMVAQVARKLFRVPRAVARLLDPARARLAEQVGIEAICPTSTTAEMFFAAVAAGPPAGSESR